VAERVPQQGSRLAIRSGSAFRVRRWIGFVEAEGVARGVGAVAEAVPDLALLVLLAAEEDGGALSLPPTSTITASGSGKPVRYQK
jgi:hypothetical protein